MHRKFFLLKNCKNRPTLGAPPPDPYATGKVYQTFKFMMIRSRHKALKVCLYRTRTRLGGVGPNKTN